MPAIAEQTTTQLAGSISNRASMISHDLENKVITVEVMVAQAPGSDTITISAPPVSVPSGTWTVSWDLVVTTPGLVAQFGSPGIALYKESQLPPDVTVVSLPTAVSSQRWALQLSNEVSDVNTIDYGIGIDWMSTGGTRTIPALVTTLHDPTIVVVKDPKDPPT
jgi:hypothetical protein